MLRYFAVVSSMAKHATAPHISAIPVRRATRSCDASWGMVEDWGKRAYDHAHVAPPRRRHNADFRPDRFRRGNADPAYGHGWRGRYSRAQCRRGAEYGARARHRV